MRNGKKIILRIKKEEEERESRTEEKRTHTMKKVGKKQENIGGAKAKQGRKRGAGEDGKGKMD